MLKRRRAARCAEAERLRYCYVDARARTLLYYAFVCRARDYLPRAARDVAVDCCFDVRFSLYAADVFMPCLMLLRYDAMRTLPRRRDAHMPR